MQFITTGKLLWWTNLKQLVSWYAEKQKSRVVWHAVTTSGMHKVFLDNITNHQIH